MLELLLQPQAHTTWWRTFIVESTITVPVAFNLSKVNGFLGCSDKDNEKMTLKNRHERNTWKKLKLDKGKRVNWTIVMKNLFIFIYNLYKYIYNLEGNCDSYLK